MQVCIHSFCFLHKWSILYIPFCNWSFSDVKYALKIFPYQNIQRFYILFKGCRVSDSWVYLSADPCGWTFKGYPQSMLLEYIMHTYYHTGKNFSWSHCQHGKLLSQRIYKFVVDFAKLPFIDLLSHTLTTHFIISCFANLMF